MAIKVPTKIIEVRAGVFERFPPINADIPDPNLSRPRGLIKTGKIYVPQTTLCLQNAIDRVVFEGEEFYRVKFRVGDRVKSSLISPTLEILSVSEPLNLFEVLAEDGIASEKQLDEIYEEGNSMGWVIDLADVFKVVARYKGKCQSGYIWTRESLKVPTDLEAPVMTQEEKHSLKTKLLENLKFSSQKEVEILRDYSEVCYLIGWAYQNMKSRIQVQMEEKSQDMKIEEKSYFERLNSSPIGRLMNRGQNVIPGDVNDSLSRYEILETLDAALRSQN